MSRTPSGSGVRLSGSIAEQSLNISAAAHYSQNHDVSVLDAVDDYILANREAPQARTKVMISGTSN
jgi:hypothetical protein